MISVSVRLAESPFARVVEFGIFEAKSFGERTAFDLSVRDAKSNSNQTGFVF
jgi:hypothetical protein